MANGDTDMSPDVTETLDIRASNVLLYDLVSDVTRMGEWSPEATGARVERPNLRAGDRFLGLNRRGLITWFTFNRVRWAQRGDLFEFDTDFGPFPISRWRYTFTPITDGVTRVSESWWDRRQGGLGLPIRAVGQVLIPGNRARHNRGTMATTLERLRVVAEANDSESPN